MAIQRQTTWGGLVTLDMFLGGIGAGAFAISFLLIFLGGITKISQVEVICTLLGPVFMIAGLFFLLLELGSPLNMFRVFAELDSSWLSRGALIQILFIVFGLAYSLPAFWSLPWLKEGVGLIVGVIAFILAVISTIYHGLFLGKAKGIVLWSSPVLPLATTLIALCSGTGLMLLIMLVYPRTELSIIFKFLGFAGVALIVGELIILWSLQSLQPNITYSESIRKIRIHMIVSTICLMVSLALLISGLLMVDTGYIAVISAVSGILLLASGLIMRFAILRAGHYPSMYIPLSR